MTDQLEPEEIAETVAPVSARTFTQDEVNALIRDRLNRQKAQLEKGGVDVEALKAQNERYQETFGKMLEEQKKGLPEPILKLLESQDPLQQLEWLQENGQVFAPKTVPASPKPASAKTDVAAEKRNNPIYGGL